MSVASILYQKGDQVATIAPSATVKSAADQMRTRNIAALVVTSGGPVLGIISEREIARAFSCHGERLSSMTVEDVMRPIPSARARTA